MSGSTIGRDGRGKKQDEEQKRVIASALVAKLHEKLNDLRSVIPENFSSAVQFHRGEKGEVQVYGLTKESSKLVDNITETIRRSGTTLDTLLAQIDNCAWRTYMVDIHSPGGGRWTVKDEHKISVDFFKCAAASLHATLELLQCGHRKNPSGEGVIIEPATEGQEIARLVETHIKILLFAAERIKISFPTEMWKI